MQSTGLVDEAVVNSFTTVLRHTSYPAADESMAGRVLTSFFASWHSEQLKGDNAVEVADTLSALRDQKTVEVVTESHQTLQHEMRHEFAGVTAKLEALTTASSTATKEDLTARVTTVTPESSEQYIDWAIETNATFVLAPLPDFDTFIAWDDLLPGSSSENVAGAADSISSYHDWEKRRDSASVRDTYDSRKLLEESSSAGDRRGAGTGKSTLTRKLVREACEGGFLAFRVALKQVALAVQDGTSFDDALAHSAFEGSGLDLTTQRLLLSRADLLIADGLDEAEPIRSTGSPPLSSWMTGHLNASAIVTTRPVGHSLGLIPGVRTLELTALSPGGATHIARSDLQRRAWRCNTR
jgi:hypothetical protein